MSESRTYTISDHLREPAHILQPRDRHLQLAVPAHRPGPALPAARGMLQDQGGLLRGGPQVLPQPVQVRVQFERTGLPYFSLKSSNMFEHKWNLFLPN